MGRKDELRPKGWMVTKYQKGMGGKNIMYKGPETECPGKEQRTGQQAELWLAWGMMGLHNMSMVGQGQNVPAGCTS